MKRQHSRKLSCAFFDIDGTLVRGFMIQSFPHYLADNGVIESKYPDKIDEIISLYSQGKASYRYAAETVPLYYVAALKDRKLRKIKGWAEKFIKSYLPTNIFEYSSRLVHSVSQLVDITIALSGSPHEVVQEIKELNFDKIYGSVFEANNGVYSGKVVSNLILGEQKAECARKLTEDIGIDLGKSVAFGDTDQDTPLLSMVNLPVAINPNRELKKICISGKWLWFSRENVDLSKILEAMRAPISS